MSWTRVDHCFILKIHMPLSIDQFVRKLEKRLLKIWLRNNFNLLTKRQKSCSCSAVYIIGSQIGNLHSFSSTGYICLPWSFAVCRSAGSQIFLIESTLLFQKHKPIVDLCKNSSYQYMQKYFILCVSLTTPNKNKVIDSKSLLWRHRKACLHFLEPATLTYFSLYSLAANHFRAARCRTVFITIFRSQDSIKNAGAILFMIIT